MIVAASDDDPMRAPAAMAAALIDEPSGFARESILSSVFVCDGVVQMTEIDEDQVITCHCY
jgi:hypothetical protein